MINLPHCVVNLSIYSSLLKICTLVIMTFLFCRESRVNPPPHAKICMGSPVCGYYRHTILIFADIKINGTINGFSFQSGLIMSFK